MHKPIGEQFNHDPRIKEAKRLIKNTLTDYQNKIIGVRKSDVSLQKGYAQWLDEISALRGRPLYFPYISSGIGRGALVELMDGSVKYDFITGIGVHIMGHSHHKMVEAGIDAAIEDTVMQGNLQSDKVSKEVMELFINAAQKNGAGLEHCFLTSSGAMANENAFKIIFQKKEPAHRWLAFKRCFTGRSLATSQMTDKPEYRQGIPPIIAVDYIPFFDEEHPAESTEAALNQLNALLTKNKNEYAGMCFELIQGEGGYYPGQSDFFKVIMDVLRKHNVAVMIDEIQTFARTTDMFAFQYFGLDQYVDVVTVGKMTQVCATLFSKDFNPKPGLLSQTFMASTSALHAGKVILLELLNGNFLGEEGKIAMLSGHFRSHLENLSRQFPDQLKGPFGFGAMVGLTYKDGCPQKTKDFLMKLFEFGVMGFSAGANPARVRFLLPAMAIHKEDIDEASRIIGRVLREG